MLLMLNNLTEEHYSSLLLSATSDRELSDGATVLYGHYCTSPSFTDVSTLALSKALNLNVVTVRKRKKELEELGYVKDSMVNGVKVTLIWEENNE